MKNIQSYPEAEAYLSQFLSSKWSYTLERMEALMHALGNPEKTLRIIHVGGTAGKGSTATMAAAILEEAGYKVGLHTSPHMISVRERLMINTVPISESDFVALLNSLLPTIEALSPTYYEITVAMMFLYFSQHHVDIAVIEVGLGGKLDGTNVLTPVVSIITNVGLDHTEILGDTVEKIALDKREIIKEGKIVISGVTQPSVQQLIIEKANAVHATLYLLDRDFSIASLPVPPLALIGYHQKTNAALAIMAVRHCGLTVPVSAITKALGRITLPGRFEQTTIANIPVVIDGAHNPMKIAALARALADTYRDTQFPTLIAVKGDKNIQEMIQILAPHVSHWYATTLERQTDWGKRVMYAAPDLAKTISSVDPKKPLTIVPDYHAFLAAIPEKNLLITGSLYLVGAVEEFMASKRHTTP